MKTGVALNKATPVFYWDELQNGSYSQDSAAVHLISHLKVQHRYR